MLSSGVRLPATMADVFPAGCHLIPDSIIEAMDYDEATGRRFPAVDKHTGKPVFQCRVSACRLTCLAGVLVPGAS
jgi:hypothetical protein